MVYHGVPSKACHECRSRRTRCNLIKPVCGQCLRTGRTCEYRDLMAMVFKNENEKLFAKDIKFPLNIEPEISLAVSPPEKGVSANTREVAQISPQTSVSNIYTEEEAIRYVFHHYVSTASPLAPGYLDYLPELMCTSRNSYLRDSVVALGFAGLSIKDRSGQAMNQANMKYNEAVSRVRQLLGDVEEAKKDELLVTVIILGLFESNSSSLPHSMESWMQHVKGSYSLLRLRGPSLLQTPIGRKLFFQIRIEYIKTCMQRRIPIPTDIDSKFCGDALDTGIESFDVSTKSMFSGARALCKLRASMTGLRDFSDPIRVIKEGNEIEMMLEQWEVNAPPEIAFINIPVSAPCEDVYGQSYHVYSDIFVAARWNNHRSVRIILHELLIEQLRFLSQQNADNHAIYRSRIAYSRALLERLSLEICATVPFYFDFHVPISSRDPRAIGGNLLMWPLYSTAVAGKVENEMLVWIVGRLRKVAREMGVGHAAALAEACVRRCEVVWRERGCENGELWRGRRLSAGMSDVDGDDEEEREDDDSWESHFVPSGGDRGF